MNKTALFPTIFAIVMAIAGLGIPIPGSAGGTPWLIAAHKQTMPDGQIVNVDNIAFFLWGHQYTVIGKIIQSTFVTYDGRDFPFYSMIIIILAIIIGVLSIFVSRDINLSINGKETAIKIPKNIIIGDKRIGAPMILLIMATFLMFFGTVYLDYSANATIIPILKENNYDVETGYGFQFMEISVLGFVLSTFMTFRKKEDVDTDIDEEKRNEYPDLASLIK